MNWDLIITAVAGWSYGTNYNCLAQDCSSTSSGGGWGSGTNYNCIAENCTATTNGGGWSIGTNYNCIAVCGSVLGFGGGWEGSTTISRNCIALNCKGLNGGGLSYGRNYNCSVINCESAYAVFNHSSTVSETHINTLLLGNKKNDGTPAAAYANNVNTELKYEFRNNATDAAVLPSVVSSNVESDIDLTSCITGITTTTAGVTIPSFAGLPTTEAQKQELKEYVKNIREHLKPLKTSILRGAGVNNATYPNLSDFEGTERPEHCTIGAFEAYED